MAGSRLCWSTIRARKILRREKSFCKIFREVFRSFCEGFQSFRKFFEVFASFSRLSDPFGPIGMHSDAFGCIRKQLEAFGRFRNFLGFFGFLSRFSTFPDVIFTKDFFHGTILNIIQSYPPWTKTLSISTTMRQQQKNNQSHQRRH